MVTRVFFSVGRTGTCDRRWDLQLRQHSSEPNQQDTPALKDFFIAFSLLCELQLLLGQMNADILPLVVVDVDRDLRLGWPLGVLMSAWMT